MQAEHAIVTEDIKKLYTKFTIPNILSFLTIMITPFIDGFFLSHYTGATAIAGINIIIPIISFIYAIDVMLTIGSAVRIGKSFGEKNIKKASETFSKMLITLIIISIILTVIGIKFNTEIAKLLGANEEILPYSAIYLEYLSYFFIFQLLSYNLSVITRTDNNPYIGPIALIIGPIINIILDYYFLVILNMGVKGVALASGVSCIVSTIIVFMHFIFKKGQLYFTLKLKRTNELLGIIYNGASEMLNEASSGIVVLIFNYILITEIGTPGVVAFTIINYAILLTGMVGYAVGDSITPLISINYGAKKYDRIKKILELSLGTVIITGGTLFLLFLFIPEKLIGIILIKEKDPLAFQISLEFAKYVKYAFLIMGINIITSALFTSTLKPIQSMVIASLRSILFPIAFVFILPIFLGNIGIYLTMPINEIISLFIIIFMLLKTDVTKLIIFYKKKDI